MGNPLVGAVSADADACPIHHFYSPHSWIEGSAVDQLRLVSHMEGVTQIAAFPDLHPGKFGPVGCAILSSKLYPELIGNDIGCGMSLFELDLPVRKIRLEKASNNLRQLSSALDDKDKESFAEHLRAIGLGGDTYPHALGSIGGGNHFCEVQQIEQIIDPALAAQATLNKQSVYLLVHSGSRAFGSAVFATIKPGQELPDAEVSSYLTKHDQAVQWASLNRQLIAERAARALRTNCRLVADAPHNVVERVRTDCDETKFLHRKGAAKADGAFVPLAGSRDALSYLVHPTGACDNSLASIAHGAGRKYNRSSMHGRTGSGKARSSAMVHTSMGGRVICEDKQMLIEEAPEAYKEVNRVLKDLEEAHLIETIASFKPLITFKKAVPLEKSVSRKKAMSVDRRDKRRRNKP